MLRPWPHYHFVIIVVIINGNSCALLLVYRGLILIYRSLLCTSATKGVMALLSWLLYAIILAAFGQRVLSMPKKATQNEGWSETCITSRTLFYPICLAQILKYFQI